MKKQIAVFTLGAALFAVCFPVYGGERIPRIGILFLGDRNQPHLESFKQGLRDLGYVEGRNIVLEYRYADGKIERLNELAKELVRNGVDVIVTTAANSARAAQEATKTIPIVVTSGNLLEVGLAKSLANPGGNITGLTVLASDLSGKRLELLKETLPKINRVAALWTPKFIGGYEETRAAAEALSLRLHSVQFHSAKDLEPAFAEIAKARDSALVVVLSPLATLHSRQIVDLALKYRLPGVYPTRQFAEEGGLMAYGPLLGDLYRRAAMYVDKILKGRRPADLPIEQPTKFEFIINLKTARQIGLTIPPNVLARADKVIR
ncbi:MAG TPA: ABC transporter substrate-binding protein [Candidatus Limnocylindria bacterium]|nr:ABC transporter substrate-binding protein [Candidatus Limnocylindria bacterium]